MGVVDIWLECPGCNYDWSTQVEVDPAEPPSDYEFGRPLTPGTELTVLTDVECPSCDTPIEHHRLVRAVLAEEDDDADA